MVDRSKHTHGKHASLDIKHPTQTMKRNDTTRAREYPWKSLDFLALPCALGGGGTRGCVVGRMRRG